MLKFDKKCVIGLGLGALIVGIAGVLFLSEKQEAIYLNTINMSEPMAVSNVEVKIGEYQGERNTNVDGKSQAESLKDIDTEKFHIYSYNSTPTVEGDKTNLWIENRDINTYSTQTVITDPNTNEVVYMTPVMEPGTFVEEQKLLKKDIDTTKGYEVHTYLYTENNETHELYSVGVATITFTKK